MKPFRIGTAGRLAFIASLGLMGVIAAERPMHAAGQATLLLQPTPLVLKDGRIANVSIHEVSFAAGRAEITAEASAGLTELTRSVGTDCFLTAQVIGHIESSEVAEDDTLNAHRLARARADAVQASLIERGLPAKAIASVWDWQFMVREPRATLWIFQLIAGEDCEGHPLREDMVAQAPQGQPAAPPAPRQAVVSALAPADPASAPGVAEAQPQPVELAPAPKAAEPQRQPTRLASTPAVGEMKRQPTGPASMPMVAEIQRQPAERAPEPKAVPTQRQAAAAPAPAAEKAPARAGVPSVTQPLPESESAPAASGKPAERSVAAVVPDTAKPAPRASKTKASNAKIEAGPEGGLIITFATNSSYFPPGAGKRLSQLLSNVDAEKRYEVSLQVAVSGARDVVGAKSPAEAKRYNTWLAERRLERVRQWLLENADPETVSIRPEYLSDDESRRVVVRLAPIG
jgi:outer membrane protein OmpA-like peptidoglycan-associated protein